MTIVKVTRECYEMLEAVTRYSGSSMGIKLMPRRTEMSQASLNLRSVGAPFLAFDNSEDYEVDLTRYVHERLSFHRKRGENLSDVLVRLARANQSGYKFVIKP